MPVREVIRPPLWLMAFLAFLFLSAVFSVWVALDSRSTIVTAALSLAALIWIWLRSPLRISVDTELRINSAHLEKRFIKSVEVLDANAVRLLRTRDADPAAFLAIRFWCSTGIKVVLDDPRDPTPYWLVSSRNGARLKKAIEA